MNQIQTISTSLLAQPLMAFLVGSSAGSATAPIPPTTHGREYQERAFSPSARNSSLITKGPTANEMYLPQLETANNNAFNRATTSQEHIIGEFRRWRLFDANWDGEGASGPDIDSMGDAIRFTRLLSEDVLAEPMIFANGRAGLYWRNADLYADLEFFGDGRIAYYVEQNGDKHKGVVKFDARELPSLFEAILPT
jgi:hypothetical protein